MKVNIHSDEWYPVYIIDRSYGKECDVPQKTVVRWRRITKEFMKIQDEMLEARNAPAIER